MNNHSFSEMFVLEETYFWFVGKQAFITAAMAMLKEKMPQMPRILDIGCGTGGTTKSLSKWGTITCIEKSTFAASLAKKRGLHVINTPAYPLPFPDNSFDIITILDVLYQKGIDEHKVLREAYRVLSPNGALIITDCAIPWIWNNHDVSMGAKYRYTKKRLSYFITRANFKIRKIQYIYASIFPLFALSRLIGKILPPSDSLPILPSYVNRLFIRLLSWEAKRMHKIDPLIGSSIMVIAHK